MHIVILNWQARSETQADEVVFMARKDVLDPVEYFVEFMRVLAGRIVEDPVMVDEGVGSREGRARIDMSEKGGGGHAHTVGQELIRNGFHSLHLMRNHPLRERMIVGHTTVEDRNTDILGNRCLVRKLDRGRQTAFRPYDRTQHSQVGHFSKRSNTSEGNDFVGSFRRRVHFEKTKALCKESTPKFRFNTAPIQI